MMFESQKKSLKFALSRQSSGVFAEMGLGKTRVALEFIKRTKPKRTLILAPSRVVVTTWVTEPKVWNCPVPVPCVGSPAKRAKILKGDHKVLSLSSSLVVWLCDYLNNNSIPWPFDLLVVDESHQFKSYSSERFKALKKQVPNFTRVLLLSGTPQEESEADLYAQAYLLDNGKRLGKNITQFRRDYMEPVPYIKYKWKLRQGADKLIQRKVKDLFITLKAEDYLDLPDKVYNNITVPLPPKVIAFYKELKKKLFIQFGDGKTIVKPANRAVATGKLAQVASGFVITSRNELVPGSIPEVRLLHEEKLNAAEEVINSASSPVLVGYWHKQSLAMLQKRFPLSVTFESDMAVVDRWNRGEIKVLLVHPQKGATGLNIQKGGHTIIWYEMPFSSTLYRQFEGRLHRTGQQYPVIIHRLLADIEIEWLRLDHLLGKKDALDLLFSYLNQDFLNLM